MNDKEQLIADIEVMEKNIAPIYANEQEFFKACEELDKYNKIWGNASLGKMLLFCVAIWILGFSIMGVFPSDFMQAVCAMVTLFFPLIFWVRVFIKKKRQDTLYEEHKVIADKVLAWLPPQYRELAYFNQIKEFVQYGRVNSLGEALNIIASDERADDIKYAMNIISEYNNI